jgi:hypothetical protein
LSPSMIVTKNVDLAVSIIIFISIDPNTEYKGCGKVIHKRITVQMYYVSINSIKTKQQNLTFHITIFKIL